MTEIEQREAVLAAARSWLGTPYRHCADVKGAGVDCAMLLVRVFVDSGLIPAFDPRPYPIDWMLHRDEERYLGFILDRGREIETPEPADIAVFKIGRCFAHGGIVERWPVIIHAHRQSRLVERHDVTKGALAARPVRFFSLWGAQQPPERLTALRAATGGTFPSGNRSDASSASLEAAEAQRRSQADGCPRPALEGLRQ